MAPVKVKTVHAPLRTCDAPTDAFQPRQRLCGGRQETTCAGPPASEAVHAPGRGHAPAGETHGSEDTSFKE